MATRTPEQIKAWKERMDEAKAKKAAEPQERPSEEVLLGIPEEELAKLRNITVKEGLGVAFDMGLEALEDRAKAIWPDMHTVLVSRDEMKGVSQIFEYEGFGYTLLEDGAKSLRTVPNRNMARMGCPLAEYEAIEAARIKEQNERHGHFDRKNAPEGQPFMEQSGAKNLSDILAGADASTLESLSEQRVAVAAAKAEGLLPPS